jgi:hypothetical protein
MPRGENAISTCPIRTATSCRLHGRSYEVESATRVRDAFPVQDWERARRALECSPELNMCCSIPTKESRTPCRIRK